MGEQISFATASFAVDPETRTLTGTLLPFGVPSAPASDGKRYQFSEDKLEVPDAAEVPHVLNYGHDQDRLEYQIGAAAKLTKTPEGVQAVYKIAKTPEGDRVLALAEGRILRSFSAEVDGEFEADDQGVFHPTTATLTGGAVVPRPAFVGAAITSVAASAAQNKENTMTETTETPQVVSFTAEDGAAIKAQVAELAATVKGLADIKAPVVETAQLSVAEEPIYRFAGSERAASGYDFAEDLLAAGKDGDQAALERVRKFTAQHLTPEFAPDGVIKTGDAANVNPATYRPDMFVGQAPTPASPLYDFFAKGTISNVQPFFWSKLDRTNTTAGVADHVEGADPAAGDLATVAGTTVTPTPVSGKVHITREVADQGGNPVVSAMVWSEFERSLKIALETKTFNLINAAAASITTMTTIATATAGKAAGLAVEGGLVDLQFIPDGFRFSRIFGHVDLYKALALATTSADEKIYPIIAPANRDGSAAERFASLQIAGFSMFPAASLGVAGGTKNSYVADSSAVHVWNSGLQRLDKLQEKVEGWDMGVFAYFAGVVYDTAGLRKIVYTP